jgi:3-deoxy-manno-octulosonate cytidylyltransferase (CMP-KDO synthetase)
MRGVSRYKERMKVVGIIPARYASTRFPAKALPLIAGKPLVQQVVKVVVNLAGAALYFSRRTIPYLREAASGSVNEQLAAFPFLKHLGIYGYRRETLLRLVRFPASPLELAENLEQLRALENGISIAVVQVNYDSVGSICRRTSRASSSF